MKPRERLKQKQTSRLYLRGKDHRECIMNGIYHNAIWLKRRQDGKDIDTLVWLKYPQRYLYLRTQYSQNGTTYSKGWIDLDRMWINAKSDAGATGMSIAKLKDYVATSRIGSSDRWVLDITKDGCVHKSVEFNDKRYSIRSFAENEMIVLWNGSGYTRFSNIYMNIFSIDEFEIDKIEVNKRNAILSLSGSYTDYYYFCDIPNGCMVYFGAGNSGDLYKIEEQGADLLVTHLYNDEPLQTHQPNLIGDTVTRAIRWNEKYYCVNAYTDSISKEYVKSICIQYSDDGSSWDITRIQLVEHATTSEKAKPYFCVRNNKMYVYVTYTPTGSEYLTKVYNIDSNTNEAVEIETLHNVLTIPVKSNMGKGAIEQTPIGYVQIQLDSTEPTTELSWHIRNLLSNDIIDGWGNIEFKDGELQDQVEEEFIFLSHSYGGGRYIYFYISADLKPNIDNFAFISDSFSNSNGVETLQTGDYCVPSNT